MVHLLENNLFIYCGNNPIVRGDNEGDFWHLLAGAVVGCVVGGLAKGISNVLSGKNFCDDIGIAMATGAASGFLAATGVPVGGQVIGNALISAGSSIICQSKTGSVDWGEVALEGVVGGIGGLVGGNGIGVPGKIGGGAKHLMNLGKQSVIRPIKTLTNKGVKAAVSEAKKAATYYVKSTKQVFPNLAKSIAQSSIPSVIYSAGTYFYNSILKQWGKYVNMGGSGQMWVSAK